MQCTPNNPITPQDFKCLASINSIKFNTSRPNPQKIYYCEAFNCTEFSSNPIVVLTKKIQLKYIPFCKGNNYFNISLDTDSGAIDLKINVLEEINNFFINFTHNLGQYIINIIQKSAIKSIIRKPVIYDNQNLTNIFGSEQTVKIKFNIINGVFLTKIFLPENIHEPIENRIFKSEPEKVETIEEAVKLFGVGSIIRLSLKFALWYDDNEDKKIGGFDVKCLQIFIIDNHRWDNDKIKTLPKKLTI